MKWELNQRTGQMEPKRKSGVCVSGRIGGIMVEDFDNNIQFLIHYGTDEVTHCIGCTGRMLNIFDTQKARQIASEIERIARAHNTRTKFSDYRRFVRGMRVDECGDCANPNPPISGMGDIAYPQNGKPGSGDLVEPPLKRKRKKRFYTQPKQRTIMTFDEFVSKNN